MHWLLHLYSLQVCHYCFLSGLSTDNMAKTLQTNTSKEYYFQCL